METKIKIKYPAGAGAVRVPRHFLALGEKDKLEQPIGVMLSVGKDDKPDGKYQGGGQTMVFNPDKAGKTQDETKWAIFFRMPPKINRHQRFTLVVFDGAKLPTELPAEEKLPKREKLYVTREKK